MRYQIVKLIAFVLLFNVVSKSRVTLSPTVTHLSRYFVYNVHCDCRVKVVWLVMEGRREGGRGGRKVNMVNVCQHLLCRNDRKVIAKCIRLVTLRSVRSICLVRHCYWFRATCRIVANCILRLHAYYSSAFCSFALLFYNYVMLISNCDTRSHAVSWRLGHLRQNAGYPK